MYQWHRQAIASPTHHLAAQFLPMKIQLNERNLSLMLFVALHV